MSTEPEKNIERQLREYAQQRRESVGAPLELHAATRKMLQDEVARTLGGAAVAAPARPKRWLASWWPQVAFGTAVFGTLAFVLFAVKMDSRLKQSPGGELYALTATLPQPAEPTSRSYTPAPEAGRLTGEKQLALSGSVAATESKLKAAGSPAGPPPVAPAGAGQAAVNSPAIAANGTVPADRASTLSLADEGRLQAAAADKELVAKKMNEVPAADARQNQLAELSRARKLAADDRPAAPAAPAPAGTVSGGALAKSEVSVSRLAPAAPLTAANPAPAASAPPPPPPAFVPAPVAKANADAFAEADAFARFKDASAPATNGTVMLRSFAAASGRADTTLNFTQPPGVPAQSFRQVPARALRRNFNSPPFPDVLQSFQLQVNGTQVRITDADGSVYDGQIVPPAEAQARGQEEVRRGAIQMGSAARGGAAGAAPPGISFVAKGVNRSLKKTVEFSGDLVAATESLNRREEESRAKYQAPAPQRAEGGARFQSAVPAQPAANQLQQLQIRGRANVVGGSQFDVHALPVK